MAMVQKHHVKHAGFFLAVTALLFNILAAAMYTVKSTDAAGGGPYINSYTASASSAKADGTSGITFTVTTFDYECNDLINGTGPEHYVGSEPEQCDDFGGVYLKKPSLGYLNFTVAVTGSGNIVTPASGTTQNTGTASFVVKSTEPGKKTVSVVYNWAAIEFKKDIQVTFTPVETVASNSKPKQSATDSAQSNAQTGVAPTSNIIVTSANLNGQALTADDQDQATGKPSINEGEEIVLSGTAAPNAKVRLYIFSEPQMVETTADKDGKWTYTVKGLPAGNHHVEAAVVDANGEEGERQQLGAFTVVASAGSAVTTTAQVTKKSSLKTTIIIASAVSLAAIAYIVWYWLHHKKSILNHHKKANTSDTTPPTETPTTPMPQI